MCDQSQTRLPGLNATLAELSAQTIYMDCFNLHDQAMALILGGARCSSVVRAFAHGAMGRRIDPSWGGPIELFLVPASAPRMV